MMLSNTIGQISVTVRGVTREFEAIRIVSSGDDLGLPDKGFAIRQHPPGYAGHYIVVTSEKDALQAIKVLAGEFVHTMLEREVGEDD